MAGTSVPFDILMELAAARHCPGKAFEEEFSHVDDRLWPAVAFLLDVFPWVNPSGAWKGPWGLVGRMGDKRKPPFAAVRLSPAQGLHLHVSVPGKNKDGPGTISFRKEDFPFDPKVGRSVADACLSAVDALARHENAAVKSFTHVTFADDCFPVMKRSTDLSNYPCAGHATLALSVNRGRTVVFADPSWPPGRRVGAADLSAVALRPPSPAGPWSWIPIDTFGTVHKTRRGAVHGTALETALDPRAPWKGRIVPPPPGFPDSVAGFLALPRPWPGPFPRRSRP